MNWINISAAIGILAMAAALIYGIYRIINFVEDVRIAIDTVDYLKDKFFDMSYDLRKLKELSYLTENDLDDDEKG